MSTHNICSYGVIRKIFCKSDMLRYGYLEVFQRVPWTLRKESTVLLMNTSFWFL